MVDERGNVIGVVLANHEPGRPGSTRPICFGKHGRGGNFLSVVALHAGRKVFLRRRSGRRAGHG